MKNIFIAQTALLTILGFQSAMAAYVCPTSNEVEQAIAATPKGKTVSISTPYGTLTNNMILPVRSNLAFVGMDIVNDPNNTYPQISCYYANANTTVAPYDVFNSANYTGQCFAGNTDYWTYSANINMWGCGIFSSNFIPVTNVNNCAFAPVACPAH